MINSRSEVGRIGEEIAARFLEKKGYTLLARNIRIAGCEIDILCQRGRCISLVEVKTISREIPPRVSGEVTHLPSASGVYQSKALDFLPEEHVDERKMQRLRMAGEAYLASCASDMDIQIDIVAVTLDKVSRRANCTLYERA